MISVLVLTPLVGALAVTALPRRSRAEQQRARHVALGASLAALGVAFAVAARFDLDAGGTQMLAEHRWIEPLGAWYAVGVDGIALLLVLLTAILTPVVILASYRDELPGRRSANSYVAYMLVLEALAFLVFCAQDAFLFYVAFEATLVPIYFLIGSYGGPGRRKAATTFLLYNLLGGLLMLAAVVGLYVVSSDAGEPSYRLADLAALPMGDGTERLLFAGFMAAFCIKAPLWPFHTWLPEAAASATPATSVLMVSVIDKVGTFGMIRWGLGLFPGAADWASPTIMALAVVSILYGALAAIGSSDLRRLVAYTSVSHFGFIILGIFAFTQTSMAGSALYMFNHGLSTAALFLVTGVMIARRGSAEIGDFGGVQKIAPVMSGVLLVAGLSSLSLPGLAPFVSEFLVLAGTFTVSVPLAAAATLGIVLAAVYVLVLYRRTMTGPLTEQARGVTELTPREIAALTPLVVVIIGLGLFPQPILDLVGPAVAVVVGGLP
ncbi:MAG: NADH-quinone oxidoreductase subunit M [Aeromicrobium sp.]|uniref:NADH-quinone oxidoreductase subunit M n=1 Tax=Aeromicrobium sp. TaxID=1871063 RepID=UPI0039E33F22